MIGIQLVVYIQVWKFSCVLEVENWCFIRVEVVVLGGEVQCRVDIELDVYVDYWWYLRVFSEIFFGLRSK